MNDPCVSALKRACELRCTEDRPRVSGMLEWEGNAVTSNIEAPSIFAARPTGLGAVRLILNNSPQNVNVCRKFLQAIKSPENELRFWEVI